MNVNDYLENDFDDQKADDISSNGGVIPPYVYRVCLEHAKAVDGDGKTPHYELGFKIIDGPRKGEMINDKMFMTEKNKKRINLFASRLGLTIKNDKGVYVKNPKRDDFSNCTNEVVYLETQVEEYTNKEGKKGRIAKPTYGGIWRIDDPKAIERMKKMDEERAKTESTKAESKAKVSEQVSQMDEI